MARGAVKTYTQIAEEEAQRLRPFQEKLRTHNRAELEAMHAKMVEAVVDANIQ